MVIWSCITIISYAGDGRTDRTGLGEPMMIPREFLMFIINQLCDE